MNKASFTSAAWFSLQYNTQNVYQFGVKTASLLTKMVKIGAEVEGNALRQHSCCTYAHLIAHWSDI